MDKGVLFVEEGVELRTVGTGVVLEVVVNVDSAAFGHPHPALALLFVHIGHALDYLSHSAVDGDVDACPVLLKFVLQFGYAFAGELSLNDEFDILEGGEVDGVGLESLDEGVIDFAQFGFVFPGFGEFHEGEFVGLPQHVEFLLEAADLRLEFLLLTHNRIMLFNIKTNNSTSFSPVSPPSGSTRVIASPRATPPSRLNASRFPVWALC